VRVSGKALRYEGAHDVNTDLIWPGKYTYLQIPPEDMPQYAMETFDPDFQERSAARSILVVGRNFGCGSSREQASECLKHSGIKAILACGFARIFYRNSINLGLPVIECPEAAERVQSDDALEFDLEAGVLTLTPAEGSVQTFSFAPYPAFVLELIRDGGLIEHICKQEAEAE